MNIEAGANSQTMKDRVRVVREAARILAFSSTKTRNLALTEIAVSLERSVPALLEANRRDFEFAEKKGVNASSLERLSLDKNRCMAMIESIRKIADLPDPIGEINELCKRPSGITVGRMRVPLGVIGIIYESRPNVTADAAALCIKSGNGVVLRGGSDAAESSRAIADCVRAGLAQSGLPVDCVYLVPGRDRDKVGEMLALEGLIDVIIPRGGPQLIERVSRESKIPLLKHLDGNCHVYVDEKCDLDMACAIAVNGKTQRFSVCNALETLLVAEEIAPTYLPRVAAGLEEKGVKLRVCPKSLEWLPGREPATEEDWYMEYLAPILAMKVVRDIDEAMAHIHHYGSAHTDVIVTENRANAMRFLCEVDSSSVMVNASPRFADGHEYGLGAEIGISTDRLHARGPVGLEGLTNQKYVVFGSGQVR